MGERSSHTGRKGIFAVGINSSLYPISFQGQSATNTTGVLGAARGDDAWVDYPGKVRNDHGNGKAQEPQLPFKRQISLLQGRNKYPVFSLIFQWTSCFSFGISMNIFNYTDINIYIFICKISNFSEAQSSEITYP